jgi:hypothetical protein
MTRLLNPGNEVSIFQVPMSVAVTPMQLALFPNVLIMNNVDHASLSLPGQVPANGSSKPWPHN